MPVRVLHHVPPDREEPGAKAALPAERAGGSECADERLLYDVVEVRFRRPGAREEPRQRARVTPDQFGRRLLVPALPGGDQRRVGRARDGGGLGWRHARYGGRGRCGEIKAPLKWRGAAPMFFFFTIVRTIRPPHPRPGPLLPPAGAGVARPRHHSPPTPRPSPAPGGALARGLF